MYPDALIGQLLGLLVSIFVLWIALSVIKKLLPDINDFHEER